MKTMVEAVSVLSLLTVLAATGCGCRRGQEEAAERTSSEAPARTMSASEFGREFEDDRYAADVEFRGKVLEVTGAVAEIGKDLVGQYRVVLEGGVACYFADGEMEHVNVLHLGQAVTVRGYFRAQQGRPVLDGCQFSVE